MEDRFPRFPVLPFIDGIWIRLLLTAMVLVASASLLTGTAATLNSTTVNPGSSFEAGTLILDDADRTTNCDSHGALVACDAFFPKLEVPGMADATTVTLTNLGTLPVGRFVLYAGACSGSLCGHTWLSIHDNDHDLCEFPVQGPGACPASVHKTYADFAAAYPESSPLPLTSDHLGGGDAYTFTAEIDPSIGNDLQNSTAKLVFTWEIVQS